MRNFQKALLCALLTPHERLAKLQNAGGFTELLVLQEELKTLPHGEVWAEFCRRAGVEPGEKWLDDVRKYENEVLIQRWF